MKIVPENRRLLTDKEIGEYVYGKYFRCIKPFLSWMKKGETFWLEYTGNNEYNVRSDNHLHTKFRMEVKQLLDCFIPCKIEENLHESLQYFHWLGELGINDIDSINYIVSRNQIYKAHLDMIYKALDRLYQARYGNEPILSTGSQTDVFLTMIEDIINETKQK